jgi:hypothetical protein
VPADKGRAAEYEAGPYKGYGRKIQEAFAAIVPEDADVGAVAEAIVKVVDAPFGKRPFRVHIDPTQDGAEVSFAVIDRVRAEMMHRVGSMNCWHRLETRPTCEMRRDDLTMEALILSISYRDQIFSPRKIATATERLAAARQLYPSHK